METSDKNLGEIYRHRFPEAHRKAKAAIWKVLVESFFQRWIGPDQTILDLGCGHGEFLNYIKCGRKIAVDVNSECASFLNSDIEFHAGSVCDLSFLPEASVDWVIASNLLEHLSGKSQVEQMLQEIRRVLKPNGQFLALGPNLRFLHGRYWDFWDHLVPITDRSLVEVLELSEFRIRECIPRFLPYTTCFNSPTNPWLVRCYLRMPIIWRILGRQFLIRAEKIDG